AEEERKRAEEEAARKAEEERRRAEEEARKAEEERRRAEEEARKAEEERKRAEEEAARRAEEERKRAEEEAARRAEEERRRAEEEAARKAEEERRRAEEEAARKAEEERRKAEEAARKAEEERRKKEIEALRTDAVNAGKKAISKDSRVDLEAALDKFHVYYDKAGKKNGSKDVTDIYCSIEEILGITYYQEKSYKLATPLLQDAYEHGKGRAGIYMADWCLRNRKDISEQAEKLRESLETALAEESLMEKYPEDRKMAIMALARIYEEGIGVDKNPAEAFKNYLKCAELGDVEAMALVGNCYLYGEGVKKDTKEAFGWNEKAAMEGNERAIRNVAVSYDFGTGVKRNAQNAIEWYKKLLEKIGNDRFAKYRIAMCLSDPDKDFGIKPTQEMYDEAISYANQAINEGEDNANYVLGYCYTFGKGVEADYAKAYQCYSKAATYGNQKAKQKLNDFTKNGMGMYVYKKK
ncbi:MAG: tetratricopeptide repeat protein, partial [Lachnospiraceae bacterium]